MSIQTKVEYYSGAFPDWTELSGNIIATTAKKLAYAKGTSKSKYTYGKGKATTEFTKAINQVFPKRSSWSKQCQAGASCDVGAATILRYCGASTTIPRGLEEQIPFMKGNSRYKDMKITSTANFKAGDVGIYLGKKSGAHIWICVGNGIIAEANHTSKYFEHLIARKYTSSNMKYFACFRMVVPIRTYMQRGDVGSEIVKLQKFLNWAGYNCGVVDGDYGAKTENGVIAFQKANGLVADGKYGATSQAKAKEFKKVTTIEVLDPYNGIFPSLRVVKNASQVITDALKWGAWIASNNIYHYGEYGNKAYITPTSKYYANGKYKRIHDITHSCGCHFCGTNKAKKVDKATKAGYIGANWEHTYVCNTFATAMYAHGGMEATAMNKCKGGHTFGFDSKGRSSVLDKSKNWAYKGKLAIKDLKAGDILVSATHMQVVYAPISSTKVKAIEATSYIGAYKSFASNNSIRIKEKSPSYLSVYRFVGNVNADISIRYGEYSDRVALWQKYLAWAGFDCGGADGKFGDKTLNATKSFQKKYGLDADGIIGSKTLAKAKTIKK